MQDTQALAELVSRAQTGDMEAFDALVRRFQDMAVGYAYSRLGEWGPAQDAAQEAFIHLYRDLPTLRAPETLIARADAAMARAKQTGQNQVQLSS